MCIEPCNLPDAVQVACRYCWQCRANRVNDLVGRCIAEQNSSHTTFAVTLTYRGTGPETAMLRYADFQKSIKLLRRHGFNPRYIVAGEFGSKKGRAHWHAVLFFNSVWVHPKTGAYGPARVPMVSSNQFAGVNKAAPSWDVTLNTNIHWKPWPHGFAFFQSPDYGGFAYVLKYALKDQDADVSKGHLAMSKKPPLGHTFFQELAERHVQQGIAPRDLFYSFGDVFDAKRKRRRFLIQGKSRENYLNTFLDRWREVHQTEPPVTEELMAHWDKLAREERALSRSDVEWQAAKRQWPKYASCDASSDASEWARQMRWDDPDLWRNYLAPIPSHLLSTLPVQMQFALDGETVPFEVLDERDGWLAFFHETEGNLSWLVNPSEAPVWQEWLQAL